MEKDIELLVLAALLHDIGKFAQRAERPKSADQVGEYCRTNDSGQSTHLHVLYTDYFIENDLPLPLELNNDRSRLARLASAHHKPAEDSLAEKAICQGDRLSAGTDRTNETEDTGSYKKARLLSVFEQVSLSGEKRSGEIVGGAYYHLSPIEESAFPGPLQDARGTSYQALFSRFLADLARLPLDQGVPRYIDAVVSLLERYTWCVPSSTYRSLPDISLYDHSITTAAIAQSLYLYHQEAGGMPGEAASKDDKFIWVGGDLSGIQKYIFEVDRSHGAGVAKLFRARSFYLQAITRSVVLEATRRAGLSPLARVMDAGGRFVLLLPATASVRQMLPELDLDLQRWFFQRFHGRLSLCLTRAILLKESDLELKKFKNKIDELNDELENAKTRKFAALVNEGLDTVMDLDFSSFAQDGACAICQIHPADPRSSAAYQSEHGEEIKLCRHCHGQIEGIGKKLPNARWLVISRDDENSDAALFGEMYMRLHGEKAPPATRGTQTVEVASLKERGWASFMPLAGNLPVITSGDLERWRSWDLLILDDQERETYRGDRVEVGAPKTFNILAGEARELSGEENGKREVLGRSFLGVFKADVDNLGFIFSVGLGGRLSMSRFVALSRMLNYFFTEYLLKLIQERHPSIYVVFSGGDDLFLLGPWNHLVEFAQEIGPAFRQFTAHNRDITVSAGLALSKPGLPVHTMADMAEKLLDQSKRRREGGRVVKDGMSVFDTTVSWDDFLLLLEKGKWLHGLLKDDKVPMGLAGRLLHYGEQKRSFESGKIEQGMFRSHMSYDFERNISEKLAERKKIFEIQQDDFLLDNIKIPVSYALYRLRKD